MGKPLLILLLACFLVVSAPAQADVKFQNGVGAGIQYGGLVGWQGALNVGDNRFKLGVGYTGFAWGYERYIGSHVSLGGQVFANQFFVGGALNANYYFNQKFKPGFVVGLDVFRAFNTQLAVAEIFIEALILDFGFDAELQNGVSVSFGYQF